MVPAACHELSKIHTRAIQPPDHPARTRSIPALVCTQASPSVRDLKVKVGRGPLCLVNAHPLVDRPLGASTNRSRTHFRLHDARPTRPGAPPSPGIAPPVRCAPRPIQLWVPSGVRRAVTPREYTTSIPATRAARPILSSCSTPRGPRDRSLPPRPARVSYPNCTPVWRWCTRPAPPAPAAIALGCNATATPPPPVPCRDRECLNVSVDPGAAGPSAYTYIPERHQHRWRSWIQVASEPLSPQQRNANFPGPCPHGHWSFARIGSAR